MAGEHVIHLENGRRRGRWTLILGLLLAVFLSARAAATVILDYYWWREVGQEETWVSMILYRMGPVLAAAFLFFLALWTAHARAVHFAGVRLRRYPSYLRLSTLALAGVSLLLALITVDSWTVVRWFGGRQLEISGAWTDPVFGHPLPFYFFHVPFYRVLLRALLVVTFAVAFVYWLTARGWQLRSRIPEFRSGAEFEFRDLNLAGALESKFLRSVGALFLAALAARYFLDRYTLLFSDHGFMVGLDYVDETIRLPLLWAAIGALLAAAVLVLAGRIKWAVAAMPVLLLPSIVPSLVNAFYVRPNEISIQRPFVERHIRATREAYGLTRRSVEVDYQAKLEAPVDVSRHRAIFENVRLWDWRAFHDTITQIQALRPYYVFPDSDVDRYWIEGQLRQVLLTPRELDVNQLPDARARWINPHFIYTHGYGVVMADASRITADGLPMLFIRNAPPEIESQALKLTRPEIYFGERTHEPIFVKTQQPEFNYPSGAENVQSHYEGTGGIPVSSFPMRLLAAVGLGDWNIVLTRYFTDQSRMIIRRDIRRRLQELADFLVWDQDPYLVINDQGRLVWICDAYTTSAAHPYSQRMQAPGAGTVNYIRNAVKATVDAYSGETHLYVFEPQDPVINAYRKLFPKLFRDASQMPEDLRRHARYPEMLFRVQAEIYRVFHMVDPEAFYNKEDLWDIARGVQGEGGRPAPLTPTYIVAALPGEDTPEFLLIIPFTPRNKDNLIGIMVARCDGERLGELVFLQLSKQELLFGPMQVEARINQDQNISKDLTLWNQQGSRVLRGQILTLPLQETVVFVEPIYIQASEARMPQLKKVVLAMGNRLIYRDTYQEALQELSEGRTSEVAPRAQTSPPAGAAEPQPTSTPQGALVEAARRHLQRYRELAGQGRWAEAGKEFEALERLLQQR